MIDRSLVAGLLLLPVLVAFPLPQESSHPGVRVTIRLEGRGSGPGAPAARPPAEIAWMIQQGAVRSELLTAIGPLPKGTVSVRRAGDTQLYVLDPARKTYYTVNLLDAPLPAPTSVTARPTGDEETIAGRRARKVIATLRLAAPPSPDESRGPYPMDAAEEIWTTGEQVSGQDDDVWLDEMERLVGIGAGESHGLPVPFARTDLGRYVHFVLKIRATVISGPMRAETTATVTSIAEERFPEEVFLVPPAGYREIPGPTRRPIESRSF